MKIRLFTIPNMLTLANLVCGSLAINFVVAQHNYTLAFGAICLGAIFDFGDGLVARLLKQSSPLGVELDSLADMVTFGVAPAMIMSTLLIEATSGCEQSLWSEWSGYIPYIIIAFSALRLARFNIDPQQSHEFVGLPTPACAIVCASLGLIASQGFELSGEWLAAISVVLAVLLISPIRMFALKFKNLSLRDNSLRYAFMAMALLLLVAKPLFALPLIVALYILISAIRHFASNK